MSTPTGFMEYSRQIQAERDPAERVLDWKEFHLHLTEEEMRTQASRCMDCGTPYCHTGMEAASGTSGCPVNNLIPEWNHLVYRGLWQEALERLHATNNFPNSREECVRRPAKACTVGLIGDPVTIKSIEEEIIERGFREGWVTAKPPVRRTGKRVAVVGSGPAGLACADHQSGRTFRHGLRARRSHRRSAYVRHSDDEARQGSGGAAGATARRGRDPLRDEYRDRNRYSGPRAWSISMMPSCCAPGRRSRASSSSRAANWKASTMRWTI